MVDYLKAAAAFRAKAAKTPFPEEAKTLIEKAEELEAKYGKPVTETPRFTDDTTTTSRDGRGWQSTGWEYDVRTSPGGFRFTQPNPPPGEDPEFDKRTRASWNELWRLFHNQHQWNRPPVDEDDLIADEFKYDPGPSDDEDYGYDIFEGEEYE